MHVTAKEDTHKEGTVSFHSHVVDRQDQCGKSGWLAMALVGWVSVAVTGRDSRRVSVGIACVS